MTYEGPDEHDAHLFDDDSIDFVKCVRCGKMIPSTVECCNYCGVWFEDEAWTGRVAGEASPGEGLSRRPRLRYLYWLAAVAVLAAFVYLYAGWMM